MLVCFTDSTTVLYQPMRWRDTAIIIIFLYAACILISSRPSWPQWSWWRRRWLQLAYCTMLRKNFMKRLSKSASDLSGCKKKTHSTSPEEEEKDLPMPNANASDEDEDGQRPASAASCRSVPEISASASKRSKDKSSLSGTLSRKAKKLRSKATSYKQQPSSEVGIRTVGGQIHSVYRGHHQVCSSYYMWAGGSSGI